MRLKQPDCLPHSHHDIFRHALLHIWRITRHDISVRYRGPLSHTPPHISATHHHNLIIPPITSVSRHITCGNITGSNLLSSFNHVWRDITVKWFAYLPNITLESSANGISHISVQLPCNLTTSILSDPVWYRHWKRPHSSYLRRTCPCACITSQSNGHFQHHSIVIGVIVYWQAIVFDWLSDHVSFGSTCVSYSECVIMWY